MDDIQFAKLKKEIEKAIGDVHMAGIKGEALNEFLRAAITTMHVKWIQRKEAKIGDSLENMKKAVMEHMVVKAEQQEVSAVHYVIVDHVYLYLTLHSILMFEKNDLEELDELVNAFNETCKKKSLPKDIVKEINAALKGVIDGWTDTIKDFTSNVNNVWNRSRGTFGSNVAIGLNLFEKMHKEGYFVRLKERSVFKEAWKDARVFVKIKGKLKHVSDKKELERMIQEIQVKGKEMTHDFLILTKMLFNTWNHINESMVALVDEVNKDVAAHELPSKDSEQMKELLEFINIKVNEKHLHSLRISNKQLEAIMQKVESDVDTLRRYAA